MKKVALVTGGGRGIGLGVVHSLLKDGFSVVMMGSSPEERYSSVLDPLKQKNLDCIYFQGSVTSDEDINRCVTKTINTYGRIDVLVNNAGIAPDVRMDLLEVNRASFDKVLKTNTYGTMFMTQCVVNQMRKQKPVDALRGIVINIGSISAEVVSLNRAEYCVSKAAVSMLTQLYAERLAGEQILVYEIRPGIIETDMTSCVKEKYDQLIENAGICPIKRWGTPEDIGKAVSALVSGKFPYTTGQIINVDGGYHIRSL